MIKGLGNDLVEIGRIRLSIQRYGHHFLNRLFTSEEQDHCLRYSDSALHFAGRFAAKEAVVKALGVGFGSEAKWHDIALHANVKGKPIVILSKALEARFNSPSLLVSITHTAEYASAIAIWL